MTIAQLEFGFGRLRTRESAEQMTKWINGKINDMINGMFKQS